MNPPIKPHLTAYPPAFVAAFTRLIDPRHEGGYTQGHGDPGGETNMGISRRSYPDEDIRHLTPERAALLYYRDFWQQLPPALPVELGPDTLDAAVNCGLHRAVEFLQVGLRLPNPDGAWGPASAAALASVVRSGGQLGLRVAAARSIGARGHYYTTLGQLFDRYGRGWTERLSLDLLDL